MRIVFDNGHLVSECDIPNSFHFARDAPVVDDDDCTGIFRDALLDLCFVDIESIGSDIDKDWLCSTEDESICG